MGCGVSRMSDLVEKNYTPSEDEPFMNERQKSYFRAKLTAWKSDILREARETLEILQQENANHPDLADRASSETDRAIELRARDRQRKLISKIDAALHRIEEGTYGYCEETGEPIALKRLDARPIATLSTVYFLPPAQTHGRCCFSGQESKLSPAATRHHAGRPAIESGITSAIEVLRDSLLSYPRKALPWLGSCKG